MNKGNFYYQVGKFVIVIRLKSDPNLDMWACIRGLARELWKQSADFSHNASLIFWLWGEVLQQLWPKLKSSERIFQICDLNYRTSTRRWSLLGDTGKRRRCCCERCSETPTNFVNLSWVLIHLHLIVLFCHRLAIFFIHFHSLIYYLLLFCFCMFSQQLFSRSLNNKNFSVNFSVVCLLRR